MTKKQDNKPAKVSGRLPPLILASQSKARRMLLENAGLTFDIRPAAIDEPKILAALGRKVPVEEIAVTLARKKALAVAKAARESALVIGSDQILYFDGRIYTKPKSREQAAENLSALAGKTHRLLSAVAVVRGGDCLWSHVETVRLTMKPLKKQDIFAYLDRAGDAALRTVGSYELEGAGAWLFDRIDGDYFTVLGLPLLPLLKYIETYGFGPFGGAQ